MTAAPSGRERVLSEARDFFLTRGYADVSMQQIADAAGMTKAAIYYHFRDKDDLFGEVVVQELRRQLQSIQEQIDLGGTLEEMMTRLVHLYVSQLNPDIVRMMRDFREHVPESRHTDVHAEFEEFFRVFGSMFERAMQSGEIREIPANLAAALFFSALMTLYKDSFHDPNVVPPDPTTTARLVTSIILHGIATPVPVR